VKLTEPTSHSGKPRRPTSPSWCPPTGRFFFDEAPTTESGTERTFATSPLEAGKTEAHIIRVRWQENGRTLEEKRTVEVTAGGNVRVGFTRPRDPN
jgi:uncharacterized protein (TIGR03000 family)